MQVFTPEQTKNRILDLLAENDMTVKDLNDKLDAKNLNLYKYLGGQTQSIRADVLASVAVALGVSCDYLLIEPTEKRRASADGLPPAAASFVRRLPETERLGFETVLSRANRSKHIRGALLDLLRIIGNEVSSPSVGSERDFMLFRACRALCRLIDLL